MIYENVKRKNFVMSLNFPKRKTFHTQRHSQHSLLMILKSFSGERDAIMFSYKLRMSFSLTLAPAIICHSIGRKKIPQTIWIYIFFFFCRFAFCSALSPVIPNRERHFGDGAVPYSLLIKKCGDPPPDVCRLGECWLSLPLMRMTSFEINMCVMWNHKQDKITYK